MALSVRAANYGRDVIDNGLIQKAIDAGADLLPICPIDDPVAQEIRDEIVARGKEWQDADRSVCLRVASGGDVVYYPDDIMEIDLGGSTDQILRQMASILEANGLAVVRR